MWDRTLGVWHYEVVENFFYRWYFCPLFTVLMNCIVFLKMLTFKVLVSTSPHHFLPKEFNWHFFICLIACRKWKCGWAGTEWLIDCRKWKCGWDGTDWLIDWLQEVEMLLSWSWLIDCRKGNCSWAGADLSAAGHSCWSLHSCGHRIVEVTIFY